MGLDPQGPRACKRACFIHVGQRYEAKGMSRLLEPRASKKGVLAMEGQSLENERIGVALAQRSLELMLRRDSVMVRPMV